jgi:hypothetical protein
MTRDWRADIVSMVRIKQAISEADAEGIWEFHLPRVAADAAALSSVEALLGVQLDPGYRSFLSYADGWPSFFQSVDLFGVADLAHGPRMDIAQELLTNLEPIALRASGLGGAQLIPIAATTVDLDLFVMPVTDGRQQPSVVWFAGYEIDRFETFHDFFLAMIEYNRRELTALENRG